METSVEERPDPRKIADTLPSAGWEIYNARRTELVEQCTSGTLNSVEQRELDWLQALAGHYADRVAPLPFGELSALEATLRIDGEAERER